MMVDTHFFDDDFKARLLETFKDLEAATDGVLIHGENFQALNLLLEKYRERVHSIYIDPPYNAAATEILYKNNYKHSSWLALMSDRLRIGKQYLPPTGILCVTIDDYEFHRLKHILDNVFHRQNHLATVVIRNNPSGRSTVRGFAINHEYGLFYARSADEIVVGRLSHTEEQINRYDRVDEEGSRFEWENLRKSSAASERADRPKQFFPLYYNPNTEVLRIPELQWHESSSSWMVLEEPSADEITILPTVNGVEKVWGYGLERTANELDQMIARQVDDHYEVYKRKYLNVEGTLPRTWWDDTAYSARDRGTRELRNLFGPEKNFDFPKAVDAVKDALRVGNVDPGTLTMDYFAGSGTTGQAIIELNREDEGGRKYILVEMGDYFDTVMKPRIQKVVFGSEWKDGVPQNLESGVSHMFKYQHLESYEDALNNVVVERPAELTPLPFAEEMRREYVLRYLLDVETRGSPTLAPEGAFEAPFDYQLRIQQGHKSPEPATVDLVETFHYLIGMQVHCLEQHEHQGRRYVVSHGSVRTENGVEQVAVIWRDTEGLDLEEEARWVNGELLPETPERVYVNGESFIANAEPLEHTFRNRMLGSS